MASQFAGEMGLDVRVVEAPEARDEAARPAPTLQAVLARGAVLTAVAYRGWSEVRERRHEQRAETRVRLLRWLDERQLLAATEPSELSILVAEVGALPRERSMGAAWRVEGAAVMAWAARLLEMPAHHELAQLPPVLDAMDDAPRGRVSVGPVRPDTDVVQVMRGSLGLLALMERHGALAGAAALEPECAAAFVRAGYPLGRAEDGDVMSRIAFERAKATRWLMGLSDQYATAAVPLPGRGIALV